MRDAMIHRCASGLVALAMLAASPAQAAAPSACKFVQLARVPLSYAGVGMSVTMDGTINGKPARMLADTGASETYVTHAGVLRFGLLSRATGRRVSGVGGESELYAARVDQFAAGPARSSATTMFVTGSETANMAFDAIAGARYLLQSDLEINLANKEMSFFKPIDCGSTHLAYWDANAVVVPFSHNEDQRENPRFDVMLNGVRLTAMIDSGATISSIELGAARRAGIDVDGPDVARGPGAAGIGTRAVASWYASAKTFSVGDETVRNPTIAVIDTGGTLPVDVLLGTDFLRSHRVLFAMSQRKIYLSYNGGTPFAQLRTVEPWLQQEADAGNADAQFRVAKHYALGRGVPADQAVADAWLAKAAAHEQPQALLVLGRRAVLQGDLAQAAPLLRRAVAAAPAGRTAPLWLFLATRDAGLAPAREALRAQLGRDATGWQVAVAGQFAGEEDSTAALKRVPASRTCIARELLGDQGASAGCPVDAAAREAAFFEFL